MLNNLENQEGAKNYIPICQESGCNGLLNVSINFDSFKINAICENNSTHKLDNLYFSTFNKYYL